MDVLPSYISRYHVHTWYLQRPEDGFCSSETGFADSCEPPSDCWELNPGPPEE